MIIGGLQNRAVTVHTVVRRTGVGGFISYGYSEFVTWKKHWLKNVRHKNSMEARSHDFIEEQEPDNNESQNSATDQSDFYACHICLV